MSVKSIYDALTGTGEVEESFRKQDQAKWEYMITNLVYTGMAGFSLYYFLTH